MIIIKSNKMNNNKSMLIFSVHTPSIAVHTLYHMIHNMMYVCHIHIVLYTLNKCFSYKYSAASNNDSDVVLVVVYGAFRFLLSVLSLKFCYGIHLFQLTRSNNKCNAWKRKQCFSYWFYFIVLLLLLLIVFDDILIS